MMLGIVSRKIRHDDGQGRVNCEIAREALRQGHRLRFFCEEIDSAAAALPGAQCHLLAPPRWLRGRLLRDQLFALRVRRRTAGCDAVLVNGFASWGRASVNAVHFVHAAWRRSPYRAASRRRDLRGLYGSVYTAANVVLERGSFRRAAAMVAVSERIRDDLVAAGVAAGKINTIVNGVDTEQFHPGFVDRAALGLPDGVVLALFAGDLRDGRKNLDSVLEALATVPALHLAIAGRHEATQWPSMASALGVADRVHFLGFRRDMPALMRGVDLFVFPSRYEPFGLVALEAMASGLPVVTVRNAGVAELITPATGCVLDDSEDTVALAAALRRLAGSAATRRAMGEAGRATARQHSWQSMAAAYVALLSRQAERRHG